MLICLFIDEIDSEGRIFNFGKSPNSFSVCGMESYICLMVLMALVFGVPLIILSNRFRHWIFESDRWKVHSQSIPCPAMAEAPERAKRDDMPPVISKPTPPLGQAGTRTALGKSTGSGGFVEPMEKSEPASDPIPVLPDMADQPDVSDLPEPVAAHTAVTPADAEPSVIEPATAQTTSLWNPRNQKPQKIPLSLRWARCGLYVSALCCAHGLGVPERWATRTSRITFDRILTRPCCT